MQLVFRWYQIDRQVVRKIICITTLQGYIVLEEEMFKMTEKFRNITQMVLTYYESQRLLAKVYQILVSPPSFLFDVNTFFN